MFRTVAEEVRALDVSRPALRRFGWVVGGVFVGIAAVVWWRHGFAVGPVVAGLGGGGAALLALGLAEPALLRPVYRVWMGLAFALGFVMTRVILTAVFVGLVTPIGLLLRLFRKDLLGRRPDPEAATYWQPNTYRDDSAARLERYY